MMYVQTMDAQTRCLYVAVLKGLKRYEREMFIAAHEQNRDAIDIAFDECFAYLDGVSTFAIYGADYYHWFHRRVSDRICDKYHEAMDLYWKERG